MSKIGEEELVLVIKLTINCESMRRVCVERLKSDPKNDSLRDNVKFNNLKKLAIDYLPNTGIIIARVGKSNLSEEILKGNAEYYQADTCKDHYEEFDVSITYFDDDGDEITLSSDIELTEALEHLKNIENQPKTRILRACAVVKRKGEEVRADVLNVPPFKKIRMAHMKRCAAQMAKADKSKMTNEMCRRRRILNGEKKVLPNSLKSFEQKENYIQEFDPDFVHFRHTCDGCGVAPIIGFRFHAKNNINFDYCQKCKMQYDSEGKNNLVFRKAQKNSDKHFVPPVRRGIRLFGDDYDLRQAIKESFATLVEDDFKRNEISEVSNRVSTMLLDKEFQGSSRKKESLKNADDVLEESSVSHSMHKFSSAPFNAEDEKVVKLNSSFDGYVSANEGKVDFASSKNDASKVECACEVTLAVSKDDSLQDFFVDAAEEKHNINEPYSINKYYTEVSEKASDVCREETVKTEKQHEIKTCNKSESDGDWDVLDEDINHPTDELSCATQLMGQSLFESDRSASKNEEHDQSSTSNRRSTSNRWSKELEQLRELGFTSSVQCVGVLEELFTANVNSNCDEPVQVEDAVERLMTKLT